MASPTASERLVVTQRDHLTLEPWTAPAPAPGEVRVRVSCSAISFGDIMLRRHVFRQRPAVAVPGYEVVGTIEAVGGGVSSVQVGDQVAAYVELGGNARHALVPARDLVVLPPGIDPVAAAAVVLNYATALGMQACAGLSGGDAFLVDGASGGVGTAMLDTARARGLRAIGTTRDPSVELFGATLLDARAPSLVEEVRGVSGGGVAAVFDSRAGLGVWRSGAMLRRGGVLVLFGLSSIAQQRGIGAAAGLVSTFASLGIFSLLPGKRHTIFAIDRVFPREPERVRGWVAQAMSMLEEATIEPIVDSCVALEEVSAAHQRVERGEVVGKVVVDCR